MKNLLGSLKDYVYIGKGQWVHKDEKSAKSYKRPLKKSEQEAKVEIKKPAKKSPQIKEFDRKEIIAWLKKSINENGYKNLTVRRLLDRFEIKRRTSEKISDINGLLTTHGLTIFPKMTVITDLDEPIRIYSFPVEEIGDTFEYEKDLENFIEKHNLFHLLSLTLVKRQHSPERTRDRLDFMCKDGNGFSVALELKNKDGGKSAVEQVLRYKSYLKQGNSKVRGVLVTGTRDIYTARALHGMAKEEQAEFQWFLYKYHQAKGSLTFEEVTYEFISKNLKSVL